MRDRVRTQTKSTRVLQKGARACIWNENLADFMQSREMRLVESPDWLEAVQRASKGLLSN